MLRKKKTKKVAKTAPAKVSKSSKLSQIDVVRLNILERFGTNSIMMASDIMDKDFGRISTGSIELDLSLGGGIPIGRIVQISGAYSVGKTAIGLLIIKNAQRMSVDYSWIEHSVDRGREAIQRHKASVESLLCAMTDIEGTTTPEWIAQVGADPDELLYSRPSGAEEALEMMLELQREGVHVILTDSIESLSPTKEQEKTIGESRQMNTKQTLIGEYLRKFTSLNNLLVREGKLPCTLIALNQLREKPTQYGDPEYTPGGRALGFYESIDLRLRRGEWVSQGSGENKRIIGNEVKYKTAKNKTFKQQQNGSYDFYFDNGGAVPEGHIDNFKEIVNAGIRRGVIVRAGAWFSYKGQNIGQGSENTIQYLRENPDVFDSVKSDLDCIVKQEVEDYTRRRKNSSDED